MSAVAGFLSAMLAGVGTFLLYTALVFGWRGLRLGPPAERASVRHQLSQALVRHGLPDVRVEELVAACGVMALVGAGMAFAIFGGIAAPIVAGLSAAAVPAAAQRARIRSQRDIARDVWPRMIEEVRLAATSLGRSIPQALFDVGLRSPIPLRPAFEAAHREWLLSTDFERALAVLKARCADATADAVCETLLVAHEVGGADVDRRLIALAEDRSADLQGRKDAASKQAGARFARCSCWSCRWGWLSSVCPSVTGAARTPAQPGSCRSHSASVWWCCAGGGPAGSCGCPPSSGCSTAARGSRRDSVVGPCCPAPVARADLAAVGGQMVLADAADRAAPALCRRCR